MSAQGRVDRARERLESAQRNETADQAIRVVKLNPPVEGGEPVALHRRVTVIRRLSESGKRTLFATIDGMQRDAAGSSNLDYSPSGDLSASMSSELTEVVASCESALLVSGAEIRGADMVLADLDEQLREMQREADAEAGGSDAGSVDGATSSSEFGEFVNQAVAAPADANSIRAGLVALRTDPRRTELVAACEADASPSDDGAGPKLFGSSSSLQTNLVRAEAEGELSEYDMAPGSPAYVLAARLEYVGISADPLEAADVADRLLAEIYDASIARAEYEASVQAMTGPAAELLERRQQTLAQRAATERKIATQKQLMRLAKAQLDTGAGHRPRGLMPVLLEEPFADLPDDLRDATLGMLSRHSEAAQVLIVTNRHVIGKWCDALEGDAGCVNATGWFAQEHSEY